eukprot:14691569-Heterocapsa_arctica.AAC.1
MDSGGKRKLHRYLESNRQLTYYRDGPWTQYRVFGRWIESQISSDRRTHLNLAWQSLKDGVGQ